MAPQDIARRVRAWRSANPQLFDDLDPATRELCAAAVDRLCDADALAGKLESELGSRRWRPLGRLLIVVSERDVLGSAMALIGSCLTGNAMRIKARFTEALVQDLKRALDLSDECCEILDWSSAEQDDHAILEGIDGVVLAGGDALIRRYRRLAPVGVRLIEYGPKVSCAVIGGERSLEAAIVPLLRDVGLFGQQVCSSPQFVLVDGAARGQKLFDLVVPRLSEMHPLSHDERLLQHSRWQELTLLGKLQDGMVCHVDRTSGWGATLSAEIDPLCWLPRGVQIVAADLDALLAAVARDYRHRLQTAGIYGLTATRLAGFTRVCSLGTMHERGPLEPHDGELELPALVELVS